VREHTLDSISMHIADMAIDVLMASPVPRLMPNGDEGKFYEDIETRNARSVSTVEGLTRLASFVHEHANEIGDVEDEFGTTTDADRRTRSLYNEITTELATLRDVLTPRVLDLADDPRLTELLFEVERSERHWRHMLWVIENDWEDRPKFAWDAVAGVFDAASAVARHIFETYPIRGENPTR
jgi:hypothetical protein